MPALRTAPIAAFAVHLLTASGAAIAFGAMIAAIQGEFTVMFGLLGVALIVDGIDGYFARRLRVAEVLPRWSGEVLDYVVDYLTYVFVPAYALASAAILPQPWAIPAAVAVAVSGALYFADREMKTKDNYFSGFPAVWNVPVFYLLLLQPPAPIAAAGIMGLAAATFLPVPFVHPFRVKRLRALTVLLLVAWAALAAFALWRDMAPGPFVTGALCAIAIYFLGAGLFRRSD
jgi:phosphatidylcholine synthase